MTWIFIGIYLSPLNIAQLGRSTRGLDESIGADEANHLLPVSLPVFIEMITFIIRVHKAFIEMDQEQAGFITRGQAAQVMRSFGGWDLHRIAIHVLAALFDAETPSNAPSYVTRASF